jgi:hypothetical protein
MSLYHALKVTYPTATFRLVSFKPPIINVRDWRCAEHPTPPTTEELEALRPLIAAIEDKMGAAKEGLEYLKSTDWYVIRNIETTAPIPLEVSEKRAAARLDINKLQELGVLL